MIPNPIARQYRELAIKAATPVGLIVVLYEMAIESLAFAMQEFDKGNIEGRTLELNYALTVISELERSLNFEAGGEVAKRLATFYEVARIKILEANIKSNKQTIERLSNVLSSIRRAWQVVEQKTGGQPGLILAPQAPNAAHTSTPSAPPDEAGSQFQWSA
jgi:flagellar protein FliS